MSTLEDLVPPLELCRKIPYEHFDDSVMVHAVSSVEGLKPFVCKREIFKSNTWGKLPAPTLVEIMSKIEVSEMKLNPKQHKAFLKCKKLIQQYQKASCEMLKLWLELNKKENKK